MNNLLSHAKHELSLLRNGESDEMQDAMDAHILKMIETFSEEGHSGFSASYAISILQKLLRFEPIVPLTGSDDEWTEVTDDMWQNKRCSHVFKGKDGKAYDIDGRIFRHDGTCYTSKESCVFIDFPYTPKSEYVDVSEQAA